VLVVVAIIPKGFLNAERSIVPMGRAPYGPMMRDDFTARPT
jgi:hypothetical protein